VSTELFLSTAVVLSPLYTVVTWQWVCMSQFPYRRIIIAENAIKLSRSLPCCHNAFSFSGILRENCESVQISSSVKIPCLNFFSKSGSA
jgi:hypothetical protein